MIVCAMFEMKVMALTGFLSSIDCFFILVSHFG